jgi:hypothetical protein
MVFIRKKEDFICGNCGFGMKGNGFTNHCSNCLWSKHVDVDPGDREEPCGGMMEPLEVKLEANKWGLIHVCAKCGFERKAILVEGDSVDEAIRIAEEGNPSSLR